jgi:acrylyl-CoA reductase (NADPH)
VGSLAVAILSSLGYETAAATGKTAVEGYLKELGASRIVPRQELARASKALEPETWAAAIDSVGGETLATILSQTRYYGCVAACGLAGGHELKSTVFPFILRGITLQGVESPMCPNPRRQQAWDRLAADLPKEKLDLIMSTAGLSEIQQVASQIVNGQVRGRIVIDVNA